MTLVCYTITLVFYTVTLVFYTVTLVFYTVTLITSSYTSHCVLVHLFAAGNILLYLLVLQYLLIM